ncbi:MAG: hypothetical protein AB7T63_10635 [Planctomycetota bacterium]
MLRRVFPRPLALALALLATALLSAPVAEAGGGPSRTVIVANADSPTSLYVANEYARMRGIPVHHICRLARIPHRQLSTVELFRERILAPLEAWLQTNGLDGDVDTIAFSTDFPFAADFSADGDPNNWDNRVPKRLSLTGATYLSRRVLAKDLDYTNLEVNRYARVRPGPPLPTTGFRSTYLWEPSGEAIRTPSADDLATDLDRYRLATMLGWHGIQGMSVPDILANLERSVGADGTSPKGTVYLMDHKDVRAKSRRMFFNQTVEELEKRGRKAVIIDPDQEGQDAVLPNRCEDVIGVVAGIAGFDWSKCGSTMLPGAIAEHLTSFGGQLDGSGQTKLTAFLAAGAAGSSGTVCEPLSIWMKFPAPFIHIHYADGASLAEAFYQSLRGPFQLLIVGDPLTRPYAPVRQVKVGGNDAKSPARGPWGLPLLEIGNGPGAHPTRLEAYVDGHRVWSGELGGFVLDTTTLEDGGHELHIAAITDDLLETRSEGHTRFVVKNGGDLPTLVLPKGGVALDDEVKLSGRAPSGVKEIALHHGVNVIATAPVRSRRWKLELPAMLLGRGRVPLYVRGVDDDGRASRSEIEDLVVEAPGGDGKPRRSPRKKPKGKTPKGQQGLEATVEGDGGTKDGIVVKELPWKGKDLLAAQLGDAAKGKVKKVTLEGEVVAPKDGIYQWAITGPGTVRLEVDGDLVFERTLEGTDAGYVETRLKEGANAIELTLEPEGPPRLAILLGGDMVPRVLGGDLLKH